MPPKRKFKPEQSDDGSSSSDSSPSPLPTLQEELVAVYTELFSGFPTESVLSQIVGVATRLSARITALSYSAATGDARVYRDCIRVTRSAISLLRPAVCELAGLEVVLVASLQSLIARLDETAPPPSRRRRR